MKLPTLKKKSGLDFNRQRNVKHFQGIIPVLLLILEILLVISLGLLTAWTFFCTISITGVSMEPEFRHGDRVLLARTTVIFTPKRGDVVAVRVGSAGSGSVSIKRVAGLPGDTLVIEGGVLYINGEKEEDFASYDTMREAGLLRSPLTLGEGEFILLGDNRNNSEDSRYESVGIVKRSDIVGKVWFNIWRFSGTPAT